MSDTAVLDIDAGIVGVSGTVSVGLRTSREPGERASDDAEPLIIASLLRRSSNGAPDTPEP